MQEYNKYKNKHITIDNINFMSIKEAKRYTELKWLERAGLIRELELQKKFELQPKYINNNGEHIRAITYVCDFYYYNCEDNVYVVEDTKGFRTETYKLKKKIFEYKYPHLKIEEI